MALKEIPQEPFALENHPETAPLERKNPMGEVINQLPSIVRNEAVLGGIIGTGVALGMLGLQAAVPALAPAVEFFTHNAGLQFVASSAALHAVGGTVFMGAYRALETHQQTTEYNNTLDKIESEIQQIEQAMGQAPGMQRQQELAPPPPPAIESPQYIKDIVAAHETQAKEGPRKWQDHVTGQRVITTANQIAGSEGYRYPVQ